MSDVPHSSSGQTCPRRRFLQGAAAGMVATGSAAWLWSQLKKNPNGSLAHASASQAKLGKLAIPGLFPGRVAEIYHPGSVKNNVRDLDAVRKMVAEGMKSLTGADHEVEAWKLFFQRGDQVGIKVVPVGQPDAISSFETVQAVAEGLISAGVRPRDILVFDRYRQEFLSVGYHKHLPEGVHWECESSAYDGKQTELSGQLPHWPKLSHVSGYDRDIYQHLDFCSQEHDPKDDRRYRSHLSNIISRKVDKFVGIPVLKDHRSAGVTLALKNLSHGSVNNVARSHGSAQLNQCHTFIPAIVAIPRLREKAVLQVLDGLIGCYEGGPGNWNGSFATWEYKSLFFATDPVAMDRIGWEIIDSQRNTKGLPPVADMGLNGYASTPGRGGVPAPEGFSMRHPQHIALAGLLGLGEYDRAKIRHTRLEVS